MSTSFVGIDVVHVGVNVFGKGGVVLHGDLHGNVIPFPFHTDRLRNQFLTGGIKVVDEIAQSVF